MLKTNSKEVKEKIRAFIYKEAADNASDNDETIPDYLKRIYAAACERVKGTCENPAENIVNSCTCFFLIGGDFEIFQTVQAWTGSTYKPTSENIDKALNLYYALLDREIQNIIKKEVNI